LVGCGGGNDIPNMAGAWILRLTPHAPGSAALLPGVTLGAIFVQTGTHLTGTVTTVNNQSTACLVGIGAPSTISLSGTLNPVPTGDVPPANLLLTLTFTSGSAASDQTISLAGHINKTSHTITDLYSFPGAGTDCVEGAYTLARAS
ncbi:MAG TPA: hypothetical protein VG498_26335, partial [Terriglobales bacterium]|nr:hypothetical protein [Terriglobales bacterium]